MTTASLRAFGKMIDKGPSTVAYWKKQNSIVMIGDLVHVEKSITKLEKLGKIIAEPKQKEPNGTKPARAKPANNNHPPTIQDQEQSFDNHGESDDIGELIIAEKKERIRKLRIDNEKEEGKLVYVDEIESLWFKYFRIVRDEVLKVAKSESDQAAGKTAHEIEMIYTNALKFVLTNLPEEPPKLKPQD